MRAIPFWRVQAMVVMALGALINPSAGWSVTNVFFNGSQSSNLVASGTTSDTLASEGYLFTYTRDKLFTGGTGLTNPIGRTARVAWPAGLEAQAVTAGPSPGKARIDVRREDGQPFAIDSFTGQLLANTAGAGGAFEIMPITSGEDAWNDPAMYNASGSAGSAFSHTTPELAGFDAYKITLYVDFALVAITLVDASPPRPTLAVTRNADGTIELSWPADAEGYLLESATGLPAEWTGVTNTPVASGDLLTLTLEAPAPQQLYRLRK